MSGGDEAAGEGDHLDPDAVAPAGAGPASTFAYERRIEFADTDTAGVVHFTSLLRYLEEAEHAFYRSLGLLAYARDPEGVFGLPRVSIRCDYRAPVGYGETVRIELVVREIGNASIRYGAIFVGTGGPEPEEIARAEMTVASVYRRAGEDRWRGTPLPDAFRRRIERAGTD